MAKCLRAARRALHIHLRAHTYRHTPQVSPETTLGRPRCREPAVILALADNVSRVCTKVCCGTGVVAELMNAHLATLDVDFGHPHVLLTQCGMVLSWRKKSVQVGVVSAMLTRCQATMLPRPLWRTSRFHECRLWSSSSGRSLLFWSLS